jgi:hypothetical protein
LYCTEVARECCANNIDCVVINFRGLGGLPLLVRMPCLIFRLTKFITQQIQMT